MSSKRDRSRSRSPEQREQRHERRGDRREEREEDEERNGRDEEGERNHERSRAEPSSLLVLRGMPEGVTHASLVAFLSPWMGYIASVAYQDGRAFAFLQFRALEGAALFMETSGGTVELFGVPARVEYSRKQPGTSVASRSEWMCGQCRKINYSVRPACFGCHQERGDAPALSSEVPSATLVVKDAPSHAPGRLLREALGAAAAERLSASVWLFRFESEARAGAVLAEMVAGRPLYLADGSGPFHVQASYSGLPLALPPAVVEAAPVEFNVDLRKHQRMYQETAALDQFYQELRKDEPSPPSPAPAALPAERKKIVEGTSCLACNKKFPNAESLEKHCKLSEQHRRNVGLPTASPVAVVAPVAPVPAVAGMRRSGQGLGAEIVPEVNERALSYKDKGYRATLSRFNRE